MPEVPFELELPDVLPVPAGGGRGLAFALTNFRRALIHLIGWR